MKKPPIIQRDSENHPALRIIGITTDETRANADYNPAREHDHYLADSERMSWKSVATRGRSG